MENEDKILKQLLKDMPIEQAPDDIFLSVMKSLEPKSTLVKSKDNKFGLIYGLFMLIPIILVALFGSNSESTYYLPQININPLFSIAAIIIFAYILLENVFSESKIYRK